jgi:hypothetical protein
MFTQRLLIACQSADRAFLRRQGETPQGFAQKIA